LLASASHAESALFTELLAATGHKSADAIESIHVPTGGDRFRPCIEDFVQFLIEECRVAAREGWREEVSEGRERFRDIRFHPLRIRRSIRMACSERSRWLQFVQFDQQKRLASDCASA
jgi:hypothetical protein